MSTVHLMVVHFSRAYLIFHTIFNMILISWKGMYCVWNVVSTFARNTSYSIQSIGYSLLPNFQQFLFINWFFNHSTQCYNFISVASFPSGYNLPYHSGILTLEVLLFLIIISLHGLSILISRTGQRLVAGIFTLPIIMGLVYFIIWQQYVLRIEIVTNSVFISFQILFFLTSFLK